MIDVDGIRAQMAHREANPGFAVEARDALDMILSSLSDQTMFAPEAAIYITSIIRAAVTPEMDLKLDRDIVPKDGLPLRITIHGISFIPRPARGYVTLNMVGAPPIVLQQDDTMKLELDADGKRVGYYEIRVAEIQ